MNIQMSDHDAFYGEFRAVTCEWIGDHNDRCRQPNIFGKSYCEHHYHQVFRTTTAQEFEKEVKQELDNLSKFKKENINDK